MSLNDEIDYFVFLDDDCVSSNSVEGTPPDAKGPDSNLTESNVIDPASTPIEPIVTEPDSTLHESNVIDPDSTPIEPIVTDPDSTPIEPTVTEPDSTPSECDDILVFDTPMLVPINITPSCSPAMLSQPSPIEEPAPLASVFDDDIIVLGNVGYL